MSHVSEASCYCGEIEFTVENDLQGTTCQCRSCQKLCTDRSFNVSSTKEGVKVTKGTPKIFVDTKTDSGKAVHRAFCGNCGSALWSAPDLKPGVVFVKAGTLHDARDVKHVASVYVESTIPSLKIGQGKDVKHFEGFGAKQVDPLSM
ncbi:hypothetical protein OIV83_005776 [Microbotryomycetes sp. JL201]|nr:hypothetical protein OIV83_005776 [Microbotryomycetes sp. JL201]